LSSIREALSVRLRRWRALISVHVVIHAEASSFSRFSHSGVVQMSFACAEQLQVSPRSSAA
jgi:hypothetical protein